MSGFVLYEGPSLLDGKPIVVIATTRSANKKTGDMVQTWILRSDIDPITASKTGDDVSICGNCSHRANPTTGYRTCYVSLFHAPLAVYKAYRKGNYAIPENIASVGQYRSIRIGAYGDPAAVPVNVWKQLISKAVNHTGYTHQWERAIDLKSLVRASVDSEFQFQKAVTEGWKTFRVAPKHNVTRHKREALCPATKNLTCSVCPIGCNGASKLNIVIAAHGIHSEQFV